MVRVAVVDDDVFRVARFGERHDFVVTGMSGKGELVDFEVDLRHGAVDLQATGVQQRAAAAPTCLVTRQQNRVARIMPKSVEEPQGWPAGEHARRGHDHVRFERALTV